MIRDRFRLSVPSLTPYATLVIRRDVEPASMIRTGIRQSPLRYGAENRGIEAEGFIVLRIQPK
jgi:hypothetical protein